MGEVPVDIMFADGASQIELVRALFLEYSASLNVSLCFQGFDKEVAALPGDYAPPSGRLLLAMRGGEAIACAALRRIEAATCEMKRLYVRPAARGIGLGRRLALAVMDEARTIGYATMRLDTLPIMVEAIGLYERMGFRRIEAYRHNPVAGAIFMERSLC